MPRPRRTSPALYAPACSENAILPTWQEVVQSGLLADELSSYEGQELEPALILELRRQYQRTRTTMNVFDRVAKVAARLQAGERITAALRHERIAPWVFYRWLRIYQPYGLPRMVYTAQAGEYHGEPMAHWQGLERAHRKKLREFEMKRRKEMGDTLVRFAGEGGAAGAGAPGAGAPGAGSDAGF